MKNLMDKISTNLLFEMMGYYPRTVFTVEALSKKYRDSLSQRLDALQYMIEEVYKYSCREADVK